MSSWLNEETAEENQKSARLLYAASRMHGDMLDLGCNSGFFYPFVKDRVKTYHGIDGSVELIGKAKALYGERLAAAAFTVFDFTNDIALPDGWVDSVFMGEVLEHLQNPKQVLREVHRVLRPGGILVLTTPLKIKEVNLLLNGVACVVGGNKDHAQEYTQEELLALVCSVGFGVDAYQLFSQNSKSRWWRLLQCVDCRKQG